MSGGEERPQFFSLICS